MTSDRFGPLLDLINLGVIEGLGGFELRFAIGQWIQFLFSADADWLPRRVDALLPPEPDEEHEAGAWRAFWGGQFRAPNVFEPIMQTLRHKYRELIRDVAAQPRLLVNLSPGHGTELLADHLLVAWIRGYEGFGRAGLFGEFMSSAPENLRAHAVMKLRSTLRQALQDSDSTWRDRVLSEVESFWEDRVQHLAASLPSGQPSPELSAFTYWLAELPPRLDDLEERLTLMCRHLELGHSFQEVAEYLIANADPFPGAAARTLRALVDRYLRAQALVWYAHKLPELVRKIWDASDDAIGRSNLRSVVSDLLEERGIDLRDSIAERA